MPAPGSGIDRVSNGFAFVLGNALETHDENAILGTYISAEVDFFYGFVTETAQMPRKLFVIELDALLEGEVDRKEPMILHKQVLRG